MCCTEHRRHVAGLLREDDDVGLDHLVIASPVVTGVVLTVGGPAGNLPFEVENVEERSFVTHPLYNRVTTS
jgi:hypothetical protein